MPGVEGENTRFYSQFQIEDIAYPRFFFATSFWDIISCIFYRISSILVSWNIISMWQGVVWRGVAPTADMEGSRALGGSYWSKYRWRGFKSPASNLLQKQKACFWPRYLVEIRGELWVLRYEWYGTGYLRYKMETVNFQAKKTSWPHKCSPEVGCCSRMLPNIWL